MLDHINRKVGIALLYRLLTLCLIQYTVFVWRVTLDSAGRSRLVMLSSELCHLFHFIDIEERLARADG